MAASDLTAQRLRELFSYDSDTGVFTRLIRTARCGRVGDRAGTRMKDGYIRIGVLGTRTLAHRLAWLYVHGRWPDADIDHIDGDRSNNAISNLRECTDFQNQQNRKPNANNKSGYAGVTFGKRHSNWIAVIRVNRKGVYLGAFKTPEMAFAAYVEAKAKLHNFHPTIRS